MRWPDGRLRLAFEYEGERWSRRGTRGDLREDEYNFTEELYLHTNGYVYHPRLLTFDASGLFTLEQVFVDSNATTREVDTDALDLGHDVRATLLDDKPVTIEAFSQRQNHEVRQSFFGITEITDTHTGADAFVKYAVLPTRLHFDHATSKGEGLDTTDQALDTFLLESANLYKGSDTRLRYEFTDLELRRTGQEFAIHNALLTNLLRFGADDQHRSTTTSRFRDQSGLVDNELVGLQNNTVLDHTPRFSTRYAAGVDLNRTDSVESRTGTAGLGLMYTRTSPPPWQGGRAGARSTAGPWTPSGVTPTGSTGAACRSGRCRRTTASTTRSRARRAWGKSSPSPTSLTLSASGSRSSLTSASPTPARW
jgi:hypothetical protein